MSNLFESASGEKRSRLKTLATFLSRKRIAMQAKISGMFALSGISALLSALSAVSSIPLFYLYSSFGILKHSLLAFSAISLFTLGVTSYISYMFFRAANNLFQTGKKWTNYLNHNFYLKNVLQERARYAERLNKDLARSNVISARNKTTIINLGQQVNEIELIKNKMNKMKSDAEMKKNINIKKLIESENILNKTHVENIKHPSHAKGNVHEKDLFPK